MEIITRAEAKEKGLKRYFTGKPCKYGHICEKLTSCYKCVQCQEEYLKKNRNKLLQDKKDWYTKNKEELAIKSKERYRDKKEEILLYQKKRYEENKISKIKYQKKYSLKNRKKISERNKKWRHENKKKINKYEKLWRSTPKGKLISFTRGTMARIVVSIKKKKEISAIESVGYTSDELKAHLENQFRDGMTWENHGTVWQIDHIIPLSWFIEKLEGQSQEAILLNANALHNLQPLLVEENLRKGNKMPWNL